MESNLQELTAKNKEQASDCKPLFFRINIPEEKKKLNELLQERSDTIVFDEIIGQVQELVKSQNPKIVYSKKELNEAALNYLGTTPLEEYGVWVYYPWSKRLVHILDEKEFVFVRTSRNQYKITPEERDILAKKKIGVIGLSVGQSVSVTLAMERVCGELRLADFDILELTNLNRIRTGVHNLGLEKVYSVAREISEIDPYLIVKCYPEGLTESNMDDFFTNGGNLDLLVEESDGFDIKILSRYKARELKIPVIMEASDKCAIDVERFDLEPNRSILHGLVDHLDLTLLKTLKTNEEKIPYMLAMVGLDTASLRLKASMLEIEQSINTWPQLASAVTMGGGITTDISRRLLLDQYTESGRYHIDIEELVGNKKERTTSTKVIDFDFPELTTKEMETISRSLKLNYDPEINDNDLNEIVKAAISAPSAGNNQPWKWLSNQNKLFLFHDKKQSVSWSDHKNFLSYISMGTAIENVILRSNELGYAAENTLFPIENNDKLIAVFSFEKTSKQNKTDLHRYIQTRCTNRKRGTPSTIESTILNEIRSESENIKDATLSFITGKTEIENIAKIVSVAERIRLLNPQGHHDFYSKEIKWGNDGKEILEGLDVRTLELSATDEIGIKVASDPKIIELLNNWKAGRAFEKLSYKSICTSSAIGLISMPGLSNKNWINAGRAVQRAWLSATKHQLSFQPISAPLFLHQLIDLNKNEKSEIEKCHGDLIKLFPSLKNNEGLFMFRLSHAQAPSAISLRKNIKDLYFKI